VNLQINRRSVLIATENSLWPDTLTEIPRSEWPTTNIPKGLVRVLRNKRFLVQEYEPVNGSVRLSVSRTTESSERAGSCEDGISWDELQSLKSQAGFGNRDAVEIYPPDGDLINVANMRHLWVLDEPLPSLGVRDTPRTLSHTQREPASTKEAGSPVYFENPKETNTPPENCSPALQDPTTPPRK
jgi:hypothetical protein